MGFVADLLAVQSLGATKNEAAQCQGPYMSKCVDEPPAREIRSHTGVEAAADAAGEPDRANGL